MDHNDAVRQAVADLMRDKAPHTACAGNERRGCPECLYTGIDERFLREGRNGQYAVIVVRVP